MDRFSAYVPNLLPFREAFVSADRSCPGCGQAQAVRLITKAIDDYRRHPIASPGVRVESSCLPSRFWGMSKTPRRSARVPAGLARRTIALASESGSFDEIFPLLEDAAAGGKPFFYICFFNEAGIARHPDMQAGAKRPDGTKGLLKRFYTMHSLIDRVKAVMPAVTATACPSHPFDMITKVQECLACRKTAFLGVFTPCPTGCLYEPSESLNVGTLAVHTGLFPLYIIENGQIRITVSREYKPPVTRYVEAVPLHRTVSADECSRVQDCVDAIHGYLQSGTEETLQRVTDRNRQPL